MTQGNGALHLAEAEGFRFSDIEAESIEWIWPGRIARRKLHILDGDPGIGKSTICLDIAARLSQGRPMPDGYLPDTAWPSVFMNAEDGAADTMKPRLAAAGADERLVTGLDQIRRGDRVDPPVLPEDIPAIEAWIYETHAKLLFIDPLVAFFSDEVRTATDHSVRRALAPLSAMADRADCAIVCVRHLRKGRDPNPLYRGGGSIGIIGAARVGLIVAPDPEVEGLYVLAVSKCNIAAQAPAVSYRLETFGGTPVVNWLGHSDRSAFDLVGDEDGGQRTKVDEAKAFLLSELEAGPRKANDLRRLSSEAGIGWRTVEDAKTKLKIKSRKRRFDNTWEWRTQEQDAAALAAEGRTTP